MTEYRKESDVKGEIFAWVSLLLGLCMVRCGMMAPSLRQSTATHHMVDRKTGRVHRETNPPGCEGPLTVAPGTLVAEVRVGGQLADYSLPSSPLCVLWAAIKAARLVEGDRLSLERRLSSLELWYFSSRLVLSHLLPPPGSHSKASVTSPTCHCEQFLERSCLCRG